MTFEVAKFSISEPRSVEVSAHFNPISLKLGFTNTIADKSGNAQQTSAKSASKLDMEIVFDSSETGEDVRIRASELRDMALVKDSDKALPKVTFTWGTFSFTGSVESINETIDFFSPEGKPLRLTAQITMKGLMLDLAKAKPGGANDARTGSAPGGGFGATGLAQIAGDSRAGRALAAANGLESMRFPGSGQLAINPNTIELKGPAGLSAPPSLPGELAAFAGLGASKGGGTGFKLELPLPSAPLDALTSGAAQFDLTGKLADAAGGRN
jgi:Contractile injection system tube protein